VGGFKALICPTAEAISFSPLVLRLLAKFDFGVESAGPRSGAARRDGSVQLLTIRRQCSHAARIKFSLASGVRKAECADSVTFSSFVKG
jgi:hypothetical protein